MSPVARDARDEITGILQDDPFAPGRDEAYACTVVSLLPVRLSEVKPHLFPGQFDIPACKKGDLVVVHIGESHHFIPDPFDEKKNYKVITPPHEMARSICEDYGNALVGTDFQSGPALFWVHQRLSSAQVAEKHHKLISQYKERQKNWFDNLIAMADADWEKNKNRMAVSDLQRTAANHHGIIKDWVTITPMENISCVFCRTMISVDSIKCANCKEVVNPEAYKRLQKEIHG